MLDAIHQDLLNGDAAAAEQKARELLAQRPNDAEVYRVLAAAQNLAGNTDGARETIDLALGKMPEDAALNFAKAGLYLDANELDSASKQLSQVIRLDPNFFPAYLLQSQLALASGQFDEAERLARVATRISPDHPQLHAIDGQVALARGDTDRALQFLSAAAQQLPGDPRVLRSLGMAYMGKQHFAFAEQTFRTLLEKDPQALDIVILLADAVHSQGRSAEALDLMEPVMAADPGAALVGNTGVLAMEAGKVDRGVELLEQAVRMQPQDGNMLSNLVQAWQETNRLDYGRTVLEELIGADNQNSLLWQSRLATEKFAGPAATDIISRWMTAMPESLEALQARAIVHDVNGEVEQGDAIAKQMVEKQPLHLDAQLRLLGRLMDTDANAAVTRVQELQELFKGKDPQVDAQLRAIYTSTLDRAGRHADAVQLWQAIQDESVSSRLPLNVVGSTRAADQWPALASSEALDVKGDLTPAGGHHQLLWGPPGSMSELIGYSLGNSGVPLLTDRFSNQPPQDYLQSFQAIAILDAQAGEQKAPAELKASMAQEWLDALAKRGAPADTAVSDALLLWDNNFLEVLRAHPKSAELVFGIRDPRDMLLHWLAFPGQSPFQFESPVAAATWLAAICNQLADIAEHNLFPHRMIRLDDALNDELALQTAVTAAFNAPVAALPENTLAGKTFAKDHWREYTSVLGEAFAILKDASQRLGYPEA